MKKAYASVVTLDTTSQDLSEDWTSEIVEFAGSVGGSLQMIYSGVAADPAPTGSFQLMVSNRLLLTTFAKYLESELVLDASCQSSMLNFGLGALGFKYAYIKYTANGQASGTLSEVNAMGKNGSTK